MFFKQIELIKLEILIFKVCKNILKNLVNIKTFIKKYLYYINMMLPLTRNFQIYPSLGQHYKFYQN